MNSKTNTNNEIPKNRKHDQNQISLKSIIITNETNLAWDARVKHWISKQQKRKKKEKSEAEKEAEGKKKEKKNEQIWWLRLTVAQFSFQSLLFNSHGKVDI